MGAGGESGGLEPENRQPQAEMWLIYQQTLFGNMVRSSALGARQGSEGWKLGLLEVQLGMECQKCDSIVWRRCLEMWFVYLVTWPFRHLRASRVSKKWLVSR
jgi:hypothetical protein